MARIYLPHTWFISRLWSARAGLPMEGGVCSEAPPGGSLPSGLAEAWQTALLDVELRSRAPLLVRVERIVKGKPVPSPADLEFNKAFLTPAMEAFPRRTVLLKGRESEGVFQGAFWSVSCVC